MQSVSKSVLLIQECFKGNLTSKCKLYFNIHLMLVLASESSFFFVLFKFCLPVLNGFDLDFGQQYVYFENATVIDLEWAFLN